MQSLAEQLYGMQVSTLLGARYTYLPDWQISCLGCRLALCNAHTSCKVHLLDCTLSDIGTVFLCHYAAFKQIQVCYGIVIGLWHYDPFSFVEKA